MLQRNEVITRFTMVILKIIGPSTDSLGICSLYSVSKCDYDFRDLCKE